MSVSNVGIGGSGRLVATLAAWLALVALCACGSQQIFPSDDSGVGSSSGASGSGSGSGGSGSGIIPAGDAGPCGLIGCLDATVPDTGAGSSGGSSSSSSGTAIGIVPAPDCPGCTTFPPASAMPCAASAPQIRIVYPTDTVLVPPNMNVMSVHWVPNGGYTQYAVDFTNSPNTDWHIITTCQNQTIDAQSGMASGGCEVVVDPVSWSKLVGANRGGQITITVRGTTDGMCATPSTNKIQLNFAEEDLIGAYYYWQSLIATTGQGVGGNGCLTAGVGGYIYKQIFGDLNGGEVNVTPCPQTINAGCNGCHSLSRDGTRMVVYSDDNDSDDEYSDVAGSYLNMTTNPATLFPGGVTRGGGGGGGQPPGFSTIDPNVTALTSATSQGYYLTSNGYPLPAARGTPASGAAYPTAVPTNGFSVWNGTSGAFINGVTIGAANTRPTMPDWSPDGNVVVYVQPAGDFTWDNMNRNDDAHVYGGSLYTVPYSGMGAFGAPTLLLQSNGENNYYPSYSPDVPMSWIIFNRVDNMNAGANCNGGFCPDDSFSNPAARLMVLGAPGGTQAPVGGTAAPIDLEKANGSPATGKLPWSNSYPRWAPFIQRYKGNPILWFTFSSTRDYGARVINQNNSPNSPALQKSGMYQCYPADAAETPGASHGGGFAPQCQEPQLWMAPLFFSEASGGKDPSGVAFWIPYQKITSHNHTAQWTWVPNQAVPMPDAGCKCQSVQFGACGAANGGCGCCVGNGYCTGGNTCYTPPN
jgi:hypothetical protein